MQYQILGRSGIRVSRICIGTAAWGVAPLAEDAPAIVSKALDMGINFFDTATSYGNRVGTDRAGAPDWQHRKASEAILGDALRGHRDEVIVATKVQEQVYPGGVNDGGPNGGGLSRYHMMKRLEESLRRLHTDHIDIYYAHHPDPTTPLEETFRAFDDMVHQGKVRYIAISTFPGWLLADVMKTCDLLNLNAPICHQVRYSMNMRDPERDVIPASQRFGLSLTAFTPLGGGLLTGMDTLKSRPSSVLGGKRWRQGQGPDFTLGEMRLAERLDAVSREWSIPAAQLALGWLLSKPAVACTIIGPENAREVAEDAPAADLKLSQEQLRILEEMAAV